MQSTNIVANGRKNIEHIDISWKEKRKRMICQSCHHDDIDHIGGVCLADLLNNQKCECGLKKEKEIVATKEQETGEQMELFGG